MFTRAALKHAAIRLTGVAGVAVAVLPAARDAATGLQAHLLADLAEVTLGVSGAAALLAGLIEERHAAQRGQAEEG